MLFSSNYFKHFFSERRFTYQGITKFSTGSYVINSSCRYHCVSCFSIALVTYSQQVNFFYIPQVCNEATSGEKMGEREREKGFYFFLCFLITFTYKKGGVTTLVTTWGAVQKHPWAVSTGEMSWQK